MNYKKTQFLMWTNIEITISSDINPEKEIYESFWIIYSYELEFSRFLKNSALTLLNQNKTLEVSQRFLEVFKKSKEIFQLTNGYFNPLINLSNIGYSHSFEANNFKKEISWNNLDIENIKVSWNTISILENQNIDFGWIVKWYVVDIVRNYLHSKWYKNFIVNAWGDIYVSWNNEWKKWVVWIDNPFIQEEIFATLELENISISTSWSYKRNWKIENNSYHHIINPLNNKCEDEIISLSLITQNTTTTDTLATACFNMWVKESLEFLEKNNIDSLIIWSDWQVYTSAWMEKYNLTFL